MKEAIFLNPIKYSIEYCLFWKRVPKGQLIYLCETEIDQLTLKYPFIKEAVG